MRKMRIAVLSAVVAASGLTMLAPPAHACGSEPGDPTCTVTGAVNATVCTATHVAKSGGKIEMGTIADCFTQTTGR